MDRVIWGIIFVAKPAITAYDHDVSVFELFFVVLFEVLDGVIHQTLDMLYSDYFSLLVHHLVKCGD